MTAALALVCALHGNASTREAVLRPALIREATAHALPPILLRRVVAHESRFRHRKHGDHGRSIGLGQLHRPLPSWLGTFTVRELEEPALNLHLTALVLADALERCHGNIRGALRHYNRGHGCGRTSAYAANVLAER